LIDTKKLKIVIDLKNVEWMNSSGLGILIGAVSLFRNNNGQLRIINVSERIQNLLKITKLAGIFETSSSLEEALSSFKN
jgi:anti-sigma B factor antagonist